MSEKTTSLRTIFELAQRMEEPLDTAIGLARGLDLIAHDLNTLEDSGPARPILALAALLADRLALVKQTWHAIIEASGQGPI